MIDLGLSIATTLQLGIRVVAPAAPAAGNYRRISHSLVYAIRLEKTARHPYGEMRRHRRRASFPWGDLAQRRKAHRLGWWLTAPVSQHHAMPYAIADVDFVRRRHLGAWAVLADARLQEVVNTPELTWRGRRIRIVGATLSCDEESPVWIARVELAGLPDFAAIAIGDAITLALGQETFAFIVDGKTLSREAVAGQRMEISAISPVALKDAPFSGTIRYYEAGAVSARAAVERFIGPTDWQLPNWIIPAGRLMFDSVTPLAAARAIVSAIGGLIESNPDGTIICRRRHPVGIPQYGQAVVAHSLFDADVMSAQTQIAPQRGFNRVTVGNEQGGAGASADRIEYVRDADDANQGTVRAWLAADRPVLLAHTGHPDTVIASLGAVTRVETETVEFIEGRASTRYPVAAIVDMTWQHTDLGSVSASGQNLAAAIPGYSLLRITYTTTSLDWRVALPIDEEVQFVLVDA